MTPKTMMYRALRPGDPAVVIEDQDFRLEIPRRVQRRIVPEIKKVHQFE